jgi:hypothetical protein
VAFFANPECRNIFKNIYSNLQNRRLVPQGAEDPTETPKCQLFLTSGTLDEIIA